MIIQKSLYKCENMAIYGTWLNMTYLGSVILNQLKVYP